MKLYTSKEIQQAVGISRALLNYDKQHGVIDELDYVQLYSTKILYTQSALRKLKKYHKALGTKTVNLPARPGRR